MKYLRIYFATLIIPALLFPAVLLAEGEQSLTITVTPPLFQVTQSPGTTWRSQLRVVNTNPYDISVTVSAKDFHPDGESGNPIFEETSKGDPNDSHRISGWIEIPPGVITIKRGVTAEIPFSLNVPAQADPGGHYGALIVSTQPQDISGGSGAGISSGISSLIFLRVPGDVIEKGSIRDFYAKKTIVETPEAQFILRFENEGNVHLVPQGEIVITNMWGKVRGKVNINESSTFGNVLPASTRKFEFLWSELDPSPLEVGRYKAVATIVYGVEGRRTIERTEYFWIVPWKPVAGIIGTLLFFIIFVTWSIRRYIRNALNVERVRLGMSEKEFTSHRSINSGEKPKQPGGTPSVLQRPITQESVNRVNDTKSNSAKSQERQKPTKSGEKTLQDYYPLIFFIFVVILGVSLISWYFIEVFQDERAYHVEQIRPK